MFVREVCSFCKGQTSTKLASYKYGDQTSKTVSLESSCKECDGFGYRLLRQSTLEKSVVIINRDVLRCLKIIVKAYGFDRVRDSLLISEELFRGLLLREIRKCTRSDYYKICSLINKERDTLSLSREVKLDLTRKDEDGSNDSTCVRKEEV